MNKNDMLLDIVMTLSSIEETLTDHFSLFDMSDEAIEKIETEHNIELSEVYAHLLSIETAVHALVNNQGLEHLTTMTKVLSITKGIEND